MAQRYINRSIETVLKRAVSEFPAVVLTGPRQSGKTTVLKHLFSKNRKYVSLEPPDIRETATEDPRGFLAMYPPPVILDEVQYAPDLLPYVKERIDADRQRPGQYLLTGSQNLLLAEKITESLAGRAAMLRLFRCLAERLMGIPKRRCRGRERNQAAEEGRPHTMKSGSTPFAAATRNLSRTPGATSASGMRVMFRPTSSGTCEPYARWAT